jgi:hypothetical protein
MFGPYEKKSGGSAFSFSIKRGEQQFSIGLELGEAELLAQFLESYLAESFRFEVK